MILTAPSTSEPMQLKGRKGQRRSVDLSVIYAESTGGDHSALWVARPSSARRPWNVTLTGLADSRCGCDTGHMTALAYIGAALAEIAGCFAFWAWLRMGKSVWW